MTSGSQIPGSFVTCIEGARPGAGLAFSWRGFPVLRPVAATLLRALEARPADLGAISNIIDHDSVLTLRLLSLYTADGVEDRRMPTTAEAVLTVGIDRLWASVAGSPDLDLGPEPLMTALGRLWLHSAATARLAAQIADAIHYADRVAAWRTGLLHEIGRLPSALPILPEPASLTSAGEAHAFGFPRGGAIARAHGTSDTICDCIRVIESRRLVAAAPKLARIVLAADLYASLAGFGCDDSAQPNRDLAVQGRIRTLLSEFLQLSSASTRKLCDELEAALLDSWIAISCLLYPAGDSKRRDQFDRKDLV